MPKRYDATLKKLIEAFPRDWLDRLGIPVDGPIEVLSPELSTVTAAADAVLRVGDLVVHIEAESGPDPGLPSRMLMYNVLTHRQTGLPVHSVAVLLRPNANPGGLTDRVSYAPRPGGNLEFRFEVLKLWELSIDDLNSSGIGFLPLSVLGKPLAGQTRRQAVPVVLDQIARRVLQELPRERAKVLIASAVILGGIYLSFDEMQKAIRGLPAMIQSSAFEVLEEIGAIKQAKKTLTLQGTERFGKPTREQKQKLDAIEDMNRLDRLILRVLKVNDWDSLLKGR